MADYEVYAFSTGGEISIFISVHSIVVHNPSLHVNEVGHEGRHDAFKNSGVASQNELVVDSSLVYLQHGCHKNM